MDFPARFSIFPEVVADRNIACCRCANDADFLFRSCERCTLLTVPVTKLEKGGRESGDGKAQGGKTRWRPPVMLQATLSLRCPLPAVRCPTKCFVVPVPVPHFPTAPSFPPPFSRFSRSSFPLPNRYQVCDAAGCWLLFILASRKLIPCVRSFALPRCSCVWHLSEIENFSAARNCTLSGTEEYFFKTKLN